MKLTFWQQKERVSGKNLSNQIQKRHLFWNLCNRLTSVTILSVILPISVVNTSLGQTISAQEIDKEMDKPVNMVLQTNSPQVVVSATVVSEIKPGESVNQREAREKAETEARARAEAEARLNASRNTVSRERRVYNDPADFDEIYRRAEQAYGVDARLLRAIHYIETGQSGSTTKTSYAGATGPMQFMPGTWRRNGVDGNGDGIADIYNVEDAVFGAAQYLKACGYPDVKAALWSYNPSGAYYRKVTGIAKELGMQIN